MHWSLDYIGKSWEIGGRGPDSFDCWGLLMDIYKKRFDIDLPNFEGINLENVMIAAKAIDRNIKNDYWREIKLPIDECAVGLSRNKVMHHVGVYLNVDGGKILHCHNGIGCVAQSIQSMKRLGWTTIKFFRYNQ